MSFGKQKPTRRRKTVERQVEINTSHLNAAVETYLHALRLIDVNEVVTEVNGLKVTVKKEI